MKLYININAWFVHEKRFNAMDKFDLEISNALQKDGRLTNQEIGDLIGLSASQCSRRRKILEKKGIIMGYSARIDQRALALKVTAMIHINLHTHDAESQKRFQDLIEEEDQIHDAFSLSGDADFILKVVAENLEQLSQFISEKLLSSNLIGNIKSYIVLKKIKEQNHTMIKQRRN